MPQKTTPSFNKVYNKNGLRWCAIDLQRQLLISQFFKRGKINTLKHKIFLIISSVIVTHSAYAQIFSNPESVTYDKKTSSLFVSNTKNGSILKVDENGIISAFVSGYSSFMGLKTYNGVLYVAENVENGDDFVRGFSKLSAKEVFTISIPNTVQLNDVEIDHLGNLYVSDRGDNKIYKINLINKSYKTINNTIQTPNGLCFNKTQNSLLVCNTVKNSNIYEIDLDTNETKLFATSDYSHFDGITLDKKGVIYLTSWSLDWKNSVLLKYDEGKFQEILTNQFGMADIEYNPTKNALEITKYWDNGVMTYKIN